jgi:peptide-methionine (S)-S-oxide reductase
MQNRTAPIVLASLALFATGCAAQQSPEERKPATVEVPAGMQTTVLGAGCFWCVEVFYEKLDGVHEAVSGYAGGSEPDPKYKEVARGQTSHAEVVQVIYDPEVVSYRELIDFFWATHDATRGDGVWPDFGPQYRSILLYQNEEEKAAIEASRRAYEAETGKTVATDVQALDSFYPAETYHQDYAKKNPNDRYVRGVLNPKLEKLRLATTPE